jgi:peroxiredoxin Q/BCP
MDAPTFTLPDQRGELVSLSDYRGRRVIIFFYPKAMTPGCTTEACDFRDARDGLVAETIDVVGISPDPPERNRAFAEKEGLGFPLLSDEDHAVADAYGAWGTKKNYGREYEGLIRSTFVVGPGGELEREYRNVRAKGHVERILSDLGL